MAVYLLNPLSVFFRLIHLYLTYSSFLELISLSLKLLSVRITPKIWERFGCRLYGTGKTPVKYGKNYFYVLILENKHQEA